MPPGAEDQTDKSGFRNMLLKASTVWVALLCCAGRG